MAGPRIIFMGTPLFAVKSLEACLSLGQVVAVLTQPDKPKGRGQELTASPVKQLALEKGLTVLQPPKLRGTEIAQQLKAFDADVTVVTAYGKILPQDVLDVPRHGSVNVHASLLPRWRGAAPIQRAIEAGDPVTGVTLMRMDAGLDTGPMIARRELAISPADTSETMHQKLSELGRAALIDELPRYLAGGLPPQPQPAEGVTLAAMLTKEEGVLDFALPAVVLERRVRAFFPWPGTSTRWSGGLLKVLRAELGFSGRADPGTVLAAGPAGIEVACGEGSLRLLELQPEGKRKLTAAQLLQGRQIPVGSKPFGS